MSKNYYRIKIDYSKDNRKHFTEILEGIQAQLQSGEELTPTSRFLLNDLITDWLTIKKQIVSAGTLGGQAKVKKGFAVSGKSGRKPKYASEKERREANNEAVRKYRGQKKGEK